MATAQEALQAAARRYQAGHLAEAEQLCERIIAADKRHAGAWQLAGIIALGTGRNELAATRLGHAIMLDGASAEAQNYFGVALHMQGKIDEAARCYREAIARNPNYAEAYNHLGNAVGDLGNL